MSKEKKEVFAHGLCFQKLFLLFVIGCVVGTYYEQILYLFQHYFKTGELLWASRRGVIYGPFSPIYGAGIVLITALLGKKQRPWYQTFLLGALIGGGFEYIISFLQEIFVGTISWDYSGHFLNFHGRTSVPIMICWGTAIMFYMHLVYPKLSSWIEKIPIDFGTIMVRILAVYLCFDMTLSWSALLRQNMRRNDIGPFTFVGEFFDRYYPDEFLKQYFPNMVVRD